MDPLFSRDGKKMPVYLIAAVLSLPLGYLLVSWSMNTYSFLSHYRPEQLFQGADGSTTPLETKGTEILEALNAEIEQDSSDNRKDESWLLAHVDQLWHSVRRYVSPSGKTQPRTPPGKRLQVARQRHASPSSSADLDPARASSEIENRAQALQDVLSLSANSEIIGRASEYGPRKAASGHRDYESLLKVSSKSLGDVHGTKGKEAAEWLYRFESLKGLRTQSVIYQFSRNLALEGTVEAQPVGETDSDLSDFGFRTVHALNFLRDLPTPGLAMGYQGVHSGYPLSYGIGLNYQVSPLVNLRFDYSYETPHEDLVEYRGSWESSLMTHYEKSRPDDSLSVHSFFLGLRYLYRQSEASFPLHTGFFYSTNMDNEPLSSNVSLGFSMGGGINRRDLHMGFAWRFRIWDNPDQQFLQKQEMQELSTRVSNQFLFTLLF